MHESLENYAESKKSISKDCLLYDFISVTLLSDKSIAMEDRLAVTRNYEGGGAGKMWMWI